MYDTFETYHPLNNFIFFVLVIGYTMLLNHPYAQLISLLCALLYALQCEGRRAVMFTLKYCLPMVLLTSFINPVFSHQGVTCLVYLPSGNPLTLESILYGVSAGAMLATILLWYINFNRVITSDKFVYLFGRIIPVLSLILSMSLRFLPRFKMQMKTVIEAQRCIGRDISNGSLLKRIKIAVTVLSIVVTWSLENAIETADSMKSRGYGLKGRTSFTCFRFDERDRELFVWFLFCGIYLTAGMFARVYAFRYFPSIRWANMEPISWSFYLVYFFLCFTPTLMNLMEAHKWLVLHSKR